MKNMQIRKNKYYLVKIYKIGIRIEKCYINSYNFYDWRKKVYNASGFKTIDSIGFWYKEISTDKGD